MRTIVIAFFTVLLSPIFLIGSKLRSRLGFPRKILIIQCAKLGDMMATTPMFRAVHEQYPNAKIHVICRSTSAVVIANNPYVEKIHTYETQSWLNLISALRREHFDWSINCMPVSFASVIGLWALIPNRVNTPSKEHGILVHVLDWFNQYHDPYIITTRTFDHYMRLLSPLGVKPIPYRLDYFPSPEDKARGEEWLKKHSLSPSSYMILNVSAGNAVKEWPLEKFAALADRIVSELKKTVVFSTLQKDIVPAIRAQMKNSSSAIDAVGFPLGTVATIQSHAAAQVSVDTGPMYVAHAVGCPVVIILGPVHPGEQVPPEGPKVAHVAPPAGCEPWMFVSRSPRHASPEQLRSVRDTSVDAVFAALKKVS